MMIEEGEPRKPPSRRRGSTRWWAERMVKEAWDVIICPDAEVDNEDREALTQSFEGMIGRIKGKSR